jgi:plastocyanin
MAALLFTCLAVACDNGTTAHSPQPNDPDDQEQPGPNEIWMEDRFFIPEELDVPVGTTVTWVNKTDEVHTVDQTNGLFNSGDMEPGESFTFTFEEAGIFEYYCEPHIRGGMTGIVTVSDSE